MKLAVIILAAALAPSWAQEIKLPPSVEKLADKAEESVVITLDRNMLKLFSKFDTRDDNVRRALGGLESVYVRSFEFAFDDQYSPADVEAVRSQFLPPNWFRIVGVRSKNRDEGQVDVFFKDGGDGKLGGIVVISAEPRELTVVSIVGTIDPSQLADLGGQFHIPRLELGLGGWRKEMK